MSVTDLDVGSRFAQALSVKDFSTIGELLDPNIDFRALTPRKAWEAREAGQVIDKVLRVWFDDSDVLEELVKVETDEMADRRRVSYRLRGRNYDGPFLIEQQAYYTEREGRIDWMRVLCSGFREA